MHKTQRQTCYFFSAILLMFGCNQSSEKTEETVKDTAQFTTIADTPSMPAYDRALDPVIVAGPNGKLLQDSLGIKIFEISVKPGELAALHRHPDHAMYILQGGKAKVYSKDFPEAENGLEMEFKSGTGWVMGPVTDSARNIGKTTIKMLEIDVYRPRIK
ncbi:MAG TPA: hypothetical protein VLC28_16660 [Flavitalea sp.]|nr:hypothetical protein [Flavitalea sp.]